MMDQSASDTDEDGNVFKKKKKKKPYLWGNLLGFNEAIFHCEENIWNHSHEQNRLEYGDCEDDWWDVMGWAIKWD